MDILNIKNEKDEFFSDYATRFTTETLRLRCTLDELNCSAFQNGLLVGSLYIELCQYHLTSTQDILKVVYIYATVVDATQRKAEKEAQFQKAPKDKL